jgi:hypothetical protein
LAAALLLLGIAVACGAKQYLIYENHGSQLVYIENLAGCLTRLLPGSTAEVSAHNEPYQDEYWTVYSAQGRVIDRPGNTCADQAACAQGTVIQTRVPGLTITLTDQPPSGGESPCVPWPFAGTMSPVYPGGPIATP